MSWLLLLQGDPVEPGSLTGEAKGAEMQLLEAFGVRGGVVNVFFLSFYFVKKFHI